jgi:mono/diheme cytochrome c family protein
MVAETDVLFTLGGGVMGLGSWRAPLALVLVVAGVAAEPSAERGRRDLLGKSYNPASMSRRAYDEVWRQWGLKQKPAAADYDRLFRQRYGLHPAPYPNDGLPMGLRLAPLLLGLGKGIGQDCLVCHGGSIAGRSYVGLGNASLDYQAFYEEMVAADGRPRQPPFQFCNVRGTSEAGGMGVFLLSYREPDLRLRFRPLDLGLHDDLCEDPPAWWLLKKKTTMYHTGSGDARSVRALMQFMLSPLNPRSAFESALDDFKDIQAYLLSLQPPKYPLAVDQGVAARGEAIFLEHCARCHGTYGTYPTYPNKIVPIDKIGTDRHRYDGISRAFAEYYAHSWFSGDYGPVPTVGYQAPPLDGIWATAPYFHNGSAPTVYHVLNSKARPRVFTRSYSTDLDAYDSRRLGWKIQVLAHAADPAAVGPVEHRKVYDTTRPGRANTGHTYGDDLTEDERLAVIEYLKTL